VCYRGEFGFGDSAEHPEFNLGLSYRLKIAGALCAEFVTLDGDGGTLVVAANDASVNHELHRAGIVEQHRPIHGKFYGHAGGEHALRREPDSATRNVPGFAQPGFCDALTIEHLVSNILFDLKAAFAAPILFTVIEDLVVLHIDHSHPLPYD
jgi:hypothetical protein